MRPITILPLSVLLASCAAAPNYDARFGNAVREARLAMIANPRAPANLDPVMGLDGKAAREGIKRYQDSFKEPPPVVNVISIGGMASSAK